MIIVTFRDSYLWSLRQDVGSRLLLVPGAQVLLIDDLDRVLFQRRSDNGLWEIPAGSCEPEHDFRGTAAAELGEETGLTVAPEDLIPFACLSDPAAHTLRYPNGDLVHAFAMCFYSRTWTGDLQGDDEVIEHRFLPISDPPSPVHPPTLAVLDLYLEYRSSGLFQAR
ncbi:NUDIX domain-containing protein [Sphaerisporangium sp. NPDC051017]|uniref:NUDIX domain-containing protein n=1 Tax=Sphaerisporangium sp. NPDC051017 TaxID=3154636 RepID=UPI00341B4346